MLRATDLINDAIARGVPHAALIRAYNRQAERRLSGSAVSIDDDRLSRAEADELLADAEADASG